MNQAAVEAVSRWRYEPVTLEGTPVPAVATVSIHFRIPDEDP